MFQPKRLGALVRGYVERAGLGKTGSCHLFRHTMATLMLEGGADIRHIQAILGNAGLSTTAVHTRVSIHQLQEVHRRTHRSWAVPGGPSPTSSAAPPRSGWPRRAAWRKARS